MFLKSLDPDNSYIPDVYDELLTQAEIQGNINKVNSESIQWLLYQAYFLFICFRMLILVWSAFIWNELPIPL